MEIIIFTIIVFYGPPLIAECWAEVLRRRMQYRT